MTRHRDQYVDYPQPPQAEAERRHRRDNAELARTGVDLAGIPASVILAGLEPPPAGHFARLAAQYRADELAHRRQLTPPDTGTLVR